MTSVLDNGPQPVEGAVWRYRGHAPSGVVEVLVRYHNGQWEHGDVDEPHLWETGWRLADWPGTYQLCDTAACGPVALAAPGTGVVRVAAVSRRRLQAKCSCGWSGPRRWLLRSITVYDALGHAYGTGCAPRAPLRREKL